MTLSVAVPRWFVDKIVNKSAGIRNPELRQIINEWLGISKLLALMPPIFWWLEIQKRVVSLFYQLGVVPHGFG